MKAEFMKKTGKALPLVIMLLAFAVRAADFGVHPGGINQDEAFAAYEAWSILNYGTDTAGYRFPVYLTAWGSGMNALESYMMIPFIALFGLEVWAIRMPQLIMALVSVWVCYLTVRKICDEKTGLAAMALLACCPWHIMLSRWGLESNLTPAFLLLGLYFFIKGTEKSPFFLLSALFYGLSLYCYATIWPIVPFLLLVQIIYCAAKKLIKPDRYTLLSALLLFLLALPLLLFLAVNYGFMEEIRGSFISVPKLLAMRSNEISLTGFREKFIILRNLLRSQSDGLPWNVCGKHGLIYFLSLPFALLGIGESVFRSLRKGAGLEPLLLMQLAAGLALGLLIEVNVNRINILFIPLVIFAALGLRFFCAQFGRLASCSLIIIYALLFTGFVGEYFGPYRDTIGYYFDAGLEDALELAEEKPAETVCLPASVKYPKVLFYTGTPLDEFSSTVEYKKYPAMYLDAKSFSNFVFGYELSQPDRDSVYIIKNGEPTESLLQVGFTLEYCGWFIVAYVPQ